MSPVQRDDITATGGLFAPAQQQVRGKAAFTVFEDEEDGEEGAPAENQENAHGTAPYGRAGPSSMRPALSPVQGVASSSFGRVLSHSEDVALVDTPPTGPAFSVAGYARRAAATGPDFAIYADGNQAPSHTRDAVFPEHAAFLSRMGPGFAR